MDYTSLAMMAFIWGGLLIYFLIPFQRIERTEIPVEKTFINALKYSFVKVTFHKKAILALILVLITIFVTLWSQNQSVLYDEIHGISTQSKPIKYTMGIIMYSGMIYVIIIGRNMMKLLRCSS